MTVPEVLLRTCQLWSCLSGLSCWMLLYPSEIQKGIKPLFVLYSWKMTNRPITLTTKWASIKIWRCARTVVTRVGPSEWIWLLDMFSHQWMYHWLITAALRLALTWPLFERKMMQVSIHRWMSVPSREWNAVMTRLPINNSDGSLTSREWHMPWVHGQWQWFLENLCLKEECCLKWTIKTNAFAVLIGDGKTCRTLFLMHASDSIWDLLVYSLWHTVMGRLLQSSSQ